MMPKNMMEYLVAIIALVALGLSIAAIAKKCKDKFADNGTCKCNNEFTDNPQCDVPGAAPGGHTGNQHCKKFRDAYTCTWNTKPGTGMSCSWESSGGGGGSPLCNKSIGDSCNDRDKDELVYCNPPKTCLITPENEHNKIGKVVSLQDPSHAGGWTKCGGSRSGCFA